MANMCFEEESHALPGPQCPEQELSRGGPGLHRGAGLDEAQRCLHCKNKPCVTGCPVKVHIPEFIAKVAEGDFEEAYQIISSTSALPAVCGRVCPQESQCESTASGA